jgi:hypothetical protein
MPTNEKSKDGAGAGARWWVTIKGDAIEAVQSVEKPSTDAAPGDPVVKVYGRFPDEAAARSYVERQRAKLSR